MRANLRIYIMKIKLENRIIGDLFFLFLVTFRDIRLYEVNPVIFPSKTGVFTPVKSEF